jgi:hypothetical protein
MARVEISDTVTQVGPGGRLRAVTGAQVLVTDRTTGDPAVVYAAESGSTQADNPIVTVNGRIEGWLELGSYNLNVTYGSGASLVTYTEPYESGAGASVEALTAEIADVRADSAALIAGEAAVRAAADLDLANNAIDRLSELVDIDLDDAGAAAAVLYDPAANTFSTGSVPIVLTPDLRTDVTPQENTRRLQAAFDAAGAVTGIGSTAGIGGRQAIVKPPAGKYKVGLPHQTNLTTNFVTGTDTVMHVTDTRELASSGTVILTDKGYSISIDPNTQATVTYTGKTGTTLTGCATTAGGGQTFHVDDAVSQLGALDRDLLTVTGDNVVIDGDGTCELDATGIVYAGAPAGNAVQGPRVMVLGRPQTADQNYGPGQIWTGQQWLDVPRSIQPNGTYDGLYQGQYTTHSDVTLTGDSANDWDPGRNNPPGEYVRVAPPAEFGAYLTSDLTASTGPGGNIATQNYLRFKRIPNPNFNLGLLSTSLASTATTATVTDFRKLAYGAYRMDAGPDLPTRTGLLLITDGTNTEWIHFQGVLSESNQLLDLQRGMFGTTARTWAASSSTTTVGSQSMSGTFSLNVVSVSGLASTGSVYLTGLGFVTYTGITGTTLTGCTGPGGTAPAGTVVTQRALILAELVKIGSELVAINDLSSNLNQLTILARGVNGTTVATHAAGDDPNGVALYVPPPGRVMLNTPIQHRVGYSPTSNVTAPVATLGVALGAVDSADLTNLHKLVTVEVSDLTYWDMIGAFKIGTEEFTYTHRDAWRLYGVTRAVHSTTADVHAVGDTVTPIPRGHKLVAAALTTDTKLYINGFPAMNSNADDSGGNAYVRAGSETMKLKSTSFSATSSNTQAGRVCFTTTTNGSITATQATIAVTDASGFVDPVAAGTGWAFAEIGGGTTYTEVIQYTGISGSTLTGVRRGYGSQPQTWNSGATIRCWTALNVNRAKAGTALSTSTLAAGTPIRRAEPWFVRTADLATNITIRGLKLTSQTSDALLPRNTVPVGNRRSAFVAAFCKNLRFEDVAVDGLEKNGILLQSCLRAWVLGSTFDNIIQQGNSGGGAIVALGACEDITAAFNVMTNLRHGGDADAAPFTDTGNIFGMCRRVKFIYNVVEKSINAAFECHAGNEDVEIGHNWFIGCQIGVLINNVSARVHHNHFKDCSSVAQIDNLTRQPGRYEFSDNKIIDSGGNAINAAVQIGQLASGPVRSPAAVGASIYRIDRNEWVGGNPTRLEFSNNYPAASPYYLTKFTGVSIQGNTVHGGLPASSTAGSGAMFYLGDLDGAIIANNSFNGVPASQEAIYADRVTNCVFGPNPVVMRAQAIAGASSGQVSKAAIVVAGGDKNTYYPAPIAGCAVTPAADFTGTTNTLTPSLVAWAP